MHLKALVRHHRPFLAATGDWEFCAQHMPQSVIADPGPVEIERPPCPKCHGPMMFTGLVSGPGGLDVRTFECSLCNCAERAVATK
jgi:hypothetical protein